ncbi:MAG: hypothetical protein IPF79_03240 [Ignavibacteria bacterium]|nr:hypothetical protein [Ignavibacteria bacterium]
MDRNNKLVISIAMMLVVATSFQMAAAGGLEPVMSNNLPSVAAITTVRDLVTSGQARYQIVERKVFAERTEIELVLTDQKGNTIGGYAQPYLNSEEEARTLWKDFVTANLTMSAVPDQISIREERKSEAGVLCRGIRSGSQSLDDDTTCYPDAKGNSTSSCCFQCK